MSETDDRDGTVDKIISVLHRRSKYCVRRDCVRLFTDRKTTLPTDDI